MKYNRYSLRASLVSVIVLLVLGLTGCGALVAPSPSLQATASTAIVTPYATPNGTQPLYRNALTAPAAGWSSGPACAFTRSGLAVRPNSGLASICFAPTSPLADISVTVMVQQTSGPFTHAFGIALCHFAPKTYVFFGIDGRGRFTFTTVSDDLSHTVIPFTPQAVIHTGIRAWNQLQAIVRGQVITLLVNGTPVGQTTLSTVAHGTVGLRGINDGEVVFQQLSIAPA